MVHRIYLHIVWTTRDRGLLLDYERARCLNRLVPSIAAQERAIVLGVGVVASHIHVMLRVHPKLDSGRFVGRVKSISALIARQEGLGDPTWLLRWGKGYSITSVGHAAIGAALRYVKSQHERHPAEAIRGDPEAHASGSAGEVAFATAM